MFGQCSPTAPQRPVLLGGTNGDPEKLMSPHVGTWINQKENEASLLLRLGPRWARREAQAGRGLSVADV